MHAARHLKMVPNIARAMLIKNVWQLKLCQEGLERDPNYIANEFGFTLTESDERQLKFIEQDKVTCPVCYEEVE